MANNSERDTHFLGFAKLLYEDFVQLARDDESKINEILAPNYPKNWRMKAERLIARRAYDLACHILYETGYGLDLFNIPDRVNDIPDLTELPK